MVVGIIIGILICVIGYLVYQNIELNKKLKSKKPTSRKLSKDQKDKIERLNKSFEELMGYDYKIALRSDK